MSPLGRKQARAAKKMQDLQPLMAELKEKYADDKERMTRETFALYKQYGVNPMGGLTGRRTVALANRLDSTSLR